MNATEHLYTREQAAYYISKTISTLNTMASRQKYKLPFIHIGNDTYYKKSTLEAFMFSPV